MTKQQSAKGQQAATYSLSLKLLMLASTILH
jgi:hypothetical protein